MPDALAAVEHWYQNAPPNAQADDGKKNGLYGGYCKLDGIKLVVGNDFLTIYRAAEARGTSIEISNAKMPLITGHLAR